MVCIQPKSINGKSNTSEPAKGHKVYPYLLRHLNITQANHVWCADITYIPMHKGFLYLVAIMDWTTRKVLSWRLSNTMDAGFCVEALSEAIARFGPPKIFNTDQGSQFTLWQWIDTLKTAALKFPWTAAGVSAGIDLALTLVMEICDKERAQVTPLLIEYDPKPPFDCDHISKTPQHIRDMAYQA